MDPKLLKKLFKLAGGKEFMEEVERLDADALNSRITRMQKDLDESEEHKENNQALRDLKDQKTQIEGPYSDVKKAVKLKTKFVIELLKEKGQE